jgi:hypothetical protein
MLGGDDREMLKEIKRHPLHERGRRKVGTRLQPCQLRSERSRRSDPADPRSRAGRFVEGSEGDGIGIRTNNFRDFLWCVGGSDAVRFELENGRILVLGTDDPNGLLHALSATR